VTERAPTRWELDMIRSRRRTLRSNQVVPAELTRGQAHDGGSVVEGVAVAEPMARKGSGARPSESHELGSISSIRMIRGDARKIPLADSTVDLIVTSPPYWRKRDYGIADQIGQEETPEAYVAEMRKALAEWRRVLRPTGSLFLNIGDTYSRQGLAGIPGRIEVAATADGWILRNRIIWAKDAGMPDPVRDRLTNRHEYILHFAPRRDYYYDLFGYAEVYSNGANPGDVWSFRPERNMGAHLAPFPKEIVRRAIYLACPHEVCSQCGAPRRRILQRTSELDPDRPQARRALELAEQHGLTAEHIAAIQATGVSDAGKALKVQNGTGRNSAEVKRLAAEAKAVLGGYFREFTFARRKTVGWTDCGHGVPFTPGVVLDPFAGTGTTLQVAASLGRIGIGVDLAPILETSEPIRVEYASGAEEG
jgi:DNA modification methylase